MTASWSGRAARRRVREVRTRSADAASRWVWRARASARVWPRVVNASWISSRRAASSSRKASCAAKRLSRSSTRGSRAASCSAQLSGVSAAASAAVVAWASRASSAPNSARPSVSASARRRAARVARARFTAPRTSATASRMPVRTVASEMSMPATTSETVVSRSVCSSRARVSGAASAAVARASASSVRRAASWWWAAKASGRARWLTARRAAAAVSSPSSSASRPARSGSAYRSSLVARMRPWARRSAVSEATQPSADFGASPRTRRTRAAASSAASSRAWAACRVRSVTCWNSSMICPAVARMRSKGSCSAPSSGSPSQECRSRTAAQSSRRAR